MTDQQQQQQPQAQAPPFRVPEGAGKGGIVAFYPAELPQEGGGADPVFHHEFLRPPASKGGRQVFTGSTLDPPRAVPRAGHLAVFSGSVLHYSAPYVVAEGRDGWVQLNKSAEPFVIQVKVASAVGPTLAQVALQYDPNLARRTPVPASQRVFHSAKDIVLSI